MELGPWGLVFSCTLTAKAHPVARPQPHLSTERPRCGHSTCRPASSVGYGEQTEGASCQPLPERLQGPLVPQCLLWAQE